MNVTKRITATVNDSKLGAPGPGGGGGGIAGEDSAVIGAANDGDECHCISSQSCTAARPRSDDVCT
eukprot:2026771-Prymnesium_polylepis.1